MSYRLTLQDIGLVIRLMLLKTSRFNLMPVTDVQETCTCISGIINKILFKKVLFCIYITRDFRHTFTRDVTLADVTNIIK